MNNKIVIPTVSGIALVIVAVLFAPNFEVSPSEKPESGTLSISYVKTNKEIQSLLAMHDISMSSALKLNGFSIEKSFTRRVSYQSHYNCNRDFGREIKWRNFNTES